MGASAEYAIRANFDVTSGLIYITAQEDIAVYIDTDDIPYNVMFYGQIEIGGSVYYVGGSGYICYIGMLQRDGSVQWMNGLVTLQGELNMKWSEVNTTLSLRKMVVCSALMQIRHS